MVQLFSVRSTHVHDRYDAMASGADMTFLAGTLLAATVAMCADIL
jgi:hypothetical protein